MDGHLGLFDCQDVNELQPLVPQLEALVQAMGEGQMVRGGGGAAADQPPNVQVAVEEVRVRAARILVRIKGAEAWQVEERLRSLARLRPFMTWAPWLPAEC